MLSKFLKTLKQHSVIYRIVKHIGAYFLMLGQAFRRPRKTGKLYRELIVREIHDLGTNSVGIVAFVGMFVGAVISIQMYKQIQGNALLQDYLIGFSTKETLILEFSPTMISIILAGKVGSFIASSIGTMRVTEQIDALDMMGVNSISYLVFPKIVATLVCFPVLNMMSIVLGIFGGWALGVLTGSWASVDYLNGIQMEYSTYNLIYSFVKTMVFAFIIATVPAYHGYHVKGGSLDVGKASTASVVWASVLIIVLDLVITQIMLS